jgi:hypothetical protein
MYRAMQKADEGPFPWHVDAALVRDAVRAECVSEAPAELPRVNSVVIEPKQKRSFRIRHLLLETDAADRSKRQSGKAGHEYQEAIVEV